MSTHLAFRFGSELLVDSNPTAPTTQRKCHYCTMCGIWQIKPNTNRTGLCQKCTFLKDPEAKKKWEQERKEKKHHQYVMRKARMELYKDATKKIAELNIAGNNDGNIGGTSQETGAVEN